MFHRFTIYIIVLFFVVGTSIAQNTELYDRYISELNDARTTKNFSRLANAYYNLALYEEEKNRNYERSFEYLSRSLEYYKVTSDTTGIYETKFHIARQLLKNNMYNDALDEFTELKKYFLESGDRKKLTEIELQLFKLYFEKLNVDNAKKSLDYIEQQLDVIEGTPLKSRFIMSQIRYNDLMQEYEIALQLANLCHEESQNAGSIEDVANCLALRGDIQLKLLNHTASITDYLQSLEFLELVPYNNERLKVYRNLASCYTAVDSIQLALLFTRKYAALQDSILNENRLIAVNNITYKYESREKNAEIKLLEREKAMAEESNAQQRRALIVLGLVLALLTIGIYYIVRFYSEKINTAKIIEEQTEKINLQKITELKDRIRINSMQSMIEGQELERERIAKDLHDSLGGLLSTIKLQIDNIKSKSNGKLDEKEVETTTHLLDAAVGEVRTISQNLQPGALSRLGLIPAIQDLVNRYDGKYGPEIDLQHFDIPIKMNQNLALGIYRVVQEILTNAIKHARASEILVQLNRKGEEIIIHIEDDGVGFDQKKRYQGMGLENIRSRVNYLKGNMEIDSRVKEGTSFIIHIPLRTTSKI
ncbi:MAG: sensor histidine kinase [Saprospiraceae bacterium]|nr:sensor histidine kinase [Saprospiraceae bacterium]